MRQNMKTTEDIRRKLNESILPDKSPTISMAAMYITEEFYKQAANGIDEYIYKVDLNNCGCSNYAAKAYEMLAKKLADLGFYCKRYINSSDGEYSLKLIVRIDNNFATLPGEKISEKKSFFKKISDAFDAVRIKNLWLSLIIFLIGAGLIVLGFVL